MERIFKRLLQEPLAPAIRFHNLRYSAATIFHSMGVHAKIVQEILGHSSIQVTLDLYRYVIVSMQHDAMNKMESFLQEAR